MLDASYTFTGLQVFAAIVIGGIVLMLMVRQLFKEAKYAGEALLELKTEKEKVTWVLKAFTQCHEPPEPDLIKYVLTRKELPAEAKLFLFHHTDERKVL